jgi:7-carboxy-7-deazaguanine synthase
MHGQNKVRPSELSDGSRLQVHEIWRTIQGEGPFFGMPAYFVRLTGCNLRCHFCDTVWDDDNDGYKTAEQIINEIVDQGTKEKNGTNLIVLTGGEPCRQNLSKLIEAAGRRNFQVQVETAGTYWQACLAYENVTIVCSPKTKHVHPMIQKMCKHWKYVTRVNETNEHDGLPARATQLINPDVLDENLLANNASPEQAFDKFASVTEEYFSLYDKYGAPARPPSGSDITVWLSPCDEGDAVRTEANVKLVGALCMKFGYRAQVQLHKLLQLP